MNYANSLKSKRNSKPRRSRSNSAQQSFTQANTSKTAQSKPDSTKADLNFLKSVVVTKENMNLISKKLKSTVKARAELLKNAKSDFLEQFPIFFTHPNVVISIAYNSYSWCKQYAALCEKRDWWL